MKWTLALVALVLCVSPLQAQSLAEAAEKAAAIKAARIAKGEWVPTLVMPNAPDPALAVVVPETPVKASGSADSTPAVEVTGFGKNRLAAVDLVGDRLTALRSIMQARDADVAQYRDACAGKFTSAGFYIRGVLVLTPNEETPTCRAIESDRVSQAAAFDLESAAIRETARTHNILPRVLRDLFASHGLPE